MPKAKGLLIRVTGVVQGVGFRPFVYRLAASMGLSGYVRNMGGSEVEIFLEGEGRALEEFLERLRREAPPTSIIEEMEVKEVRPRGLKSFRIERSGGAVSLLSMVPPDVGICEECLKEVLNPDSRWYRYPFNSCAWCGPRFTMIERIPYDRQNTSMRDFLLCEACLREYSDPKNVRRFHAQGISCPTCGPKLKLIDSGGEEVGGDPLREAAKLIDEGYIVAVKGLGGFHLAALASDDDVVAKLRRRKRRPRKPFALMVVDLKVAKRIVVMSHEGARLLSSPQRPIVVLPRAPNSPASKLVAPNLNSLGIMLPYTALHYLLLADVRDGFAIMTSGNKGGRPIVKDEGTALRELRGIADYFLIHDRRIVNRCDDSVLRLTRDKPVFLRRSRGYVPSWVRLDERVDKPLICLGAETAMAAALVVDRYAILTQYIGDLVNLSNLSYLKEALDFLLKTYKVKVGDSRIIVDLHPSYLSTRLGEELAKEHGAELVKVQHHHAHIASVMAERGLRSVVGIAMDGAGYGLDGRVWGGEVLKVSPEGFERVGRLKYHVMPGGDRATLYPVRMLMGILSSFLEDNEIVNVVRKRGLMGGLKYGEMELEACLKQARSQRSPLTSSTGRVLDAFSALLGICLERSYEGEPAIVLEEYARGGRLVDCIEFPISREGGCWVVDTSRAFEDSLDALDSEDLRSLAFTFQYELGRALGEVACRVSRGTGTEYIVASGGCAVNDIIIRGMGDRLAEEGLSLILNSKVPPGDGGIALGQAYVAAKLTDGGSACSGLSTD